MANILNEILKRLPDTAKISDSCFEAANIILYTKNKEFFLNNEGIIKGIVDEFKKRVELRPDPSITLDQEKAKKIIKELLPTEAGVDEIIFDSSRSRVIIEADKPGLAIGKQGEVLKEIRRKTLWVPVVRRTPALKSKIIENIRYVLYENSEYRRKFLDKAGHRIYDGWLREKKHEWIRLTFLGGGRQVGRSCLFLQTPESRIMMDCGYNPSGGDTEEAYPYFDAPEFKIDELDAIILTHAHLDHCAWIPFLYKMGFKGPTYLTAPTRDIAALLLLDFIGVAFKQAKKSLFSSTDVKEFVKHTICLDYGEVSDITPDIRITLYNAGHVLGSSIIHLHVGNGLHNLIYSLDWKTPVVLLDTKENVEFKPIGEIVDNLFEKYPDLVKNKIGYEEIDNLESLKTISFNPKNLKNEIRPITGFIRHKINDDLYEVKTSSGRSSVVTGSHSLFSVFNNEVKAVQVSNLNVGDFVIGPKIIPNTKKIPELNLLDYSDKLRITLDDENLLMVKLEEHKKNFWKLQENDRKKATNWIMDHYKMAMYKEDIARKYGVHPRRVRRSFNLLGIRDHPRVKHSLPHKIKINEDFARFLGYYVSEGSRRKNSQTIGITNYSRVILEDCKHIIEKTFKINVDLRDKEILINSKQLKFLISNVLNCGEGAYTKRVPKEILFADKKILKNFLYGYFSGDGGIRVRADSREIMAGSKNPLLIQDIAFMLLQFGIVPTIQHNKYTDMHIATIYGSDKLKQFLHEIGIDNGGRNKLTTALNNMIYNKASFDLRIPLISLSKKGQVMMSKSPYKNAKTCSIKKLKNEFNLNEKIIASDFMFDQIISIKKIKPTSKHVYDLKVEGYENFLGGNGFLFLHNTGDIKCIRTQLLEPAETNFPRLETAIIESTYGGKDNILKSRKEAEDEFIDIIKKTIERGGKVLIPELGVGRSQETMLIVERAVKEGRLPKVPFYVQGMIWDVTAIHTAYPDFLNKNIRRAIFHKDENPFLSDIFKRVASKKEQQEVIEGGPCVIMATSGMLTSGASVEYFRQLADNPKNTLLFVSYQGDGTLGRRIQNGDKDIVMINEEGKQETVKVNIEINTISALTGHAGRQELLRFVSNLNPKPKKIIINHGESSRCLDLASSLHKMYRVETVAPRNLETIRIK